jgi:hypothetical protein
MPLRVRSAGLERPRAWRSGNWPTLPQYWWFERPAWRGYVEPMPRQNKDPRREHLQG